MFQGNKKPLRRLRWVSKGRRILLLITLLFLFQHDGYSQKKSQERIDSLLLELSKAKDDTSKLNLFADLMFARVEYNPKEGLGYEQAALSLAQFPET